jgi:hypothetical protein
MLKKLIKNIIFVDFQNKCLYDYKKVGQEKKSFQPIPYLCKKKKGN